MAARGAKADIFYGASGTLKTTNIGKAALWAMKKYAKQTRLISADGGGWGPIQSLVDSGVIIPWMIRDHSNLIESMDLASQGYWPEDPDDPNGRLLPPFVIQYVGKCTKCHEDITSSRPQPVPVPCPKCKEPTTFSMQRTPSEKNDLSKIAIVAFEGITSFGDAAIAYLSKQRAVVTGDKEPPMQFTDGSVTFSGASGSYFGLIQGLIPEWVAKSNALPVDKVIWTALEGKGIDEATKAPMFGPLFPGAAAAARMTGKSGGWFGNQLHFEAVERTVTSTDGGPLVVETEYRMYCRPHADPMSKAMFHCKTRAPFQFANEIPVHMEPDVEKLYNKIDDLQAKALGVVQKAKEAVTA